MTLSSYIIDPDRIAPEIWSGRDAVMAEGMFGGINSTRSAMESTGFVDAADLIPFTHISWPGGNCRKQP